MDSGAQAVSSAADAGAARVSQAAHDHAKRVAARAEKRADIVSSIFDSGSRAVSSTANFGSRNVQSLADGIEVRVENLERAVPRVPGLGLLTSAARGIAGLAGNFTGETMTAAKSFGSSLLNLGRRTGGATIESAKAAANRVVPGNNLAQQNRNPPNSSPTEEDPSSATQENAEAPEELVNNHKEADGNANAQETNQDDQTATTVSTAIDDSQGQALAEEQPSVTEVEGESSTVAAEADESSSTEAQSTDKPELTTEMVTPDAVQNEAISTEANTIS